MKRLAWMLAAILVAVSTAACGSSSDSGTSPLQDQIQGTWVECVLYSATPVNTYMGTTITVNGLNASFVVAVYGTANCTGTPVQPIATGNGTAAIGSAVSVLLGGAPVQAYQLQISLPTLATTYYTLGYVSTSVTPNRLYTGTLNTALPYPTALVETEWFVKQ